MTANPNFRREEKHKIILALELSTDPKLCEQLIRESGLPKEFFLAPPYFENERFMFIEIPVILQK